MRATWISAIQIRFILLLLLAYFFYPGRASAQENENEAKSRVEVAFSTGDSRALLEHAAERMEVAMFGTSVQYSRNQAHYVLQEFFRQHPPARFSVSSTSETNGSLFLSGMYWAKSEDRPLNVVIRLRKRDGIWELRDIRVDARLRD